MTTTGQTDLPKVGDLVMDGGGDLGIISLVERTGNTLYFVCWSSGKLKGYTTAHSIYDIENWRKKLTEKT